MSQPLPTGDFRWVEEKFTLDYIKQLSDTSEKGYFFEVDISYPKELHDKHNTFPLAPHHKDIKPEDLSKYQLDLAEKLELKVGGKKLVTTFEPKKSYVLHLRNLKQYIEQGLHIDKIHRILEFKQDAWLKPYIEKNTKLRKKAQENGELDIVDFAKLMNNSGKLFFSFRQFLITNLISLWKNS